MARLMRVVPADMWRLSADLESRRARLVDGVHPEDLLKRVAADAHAAAQSRSIPLCWQESSDEGREGYFRLSSQFPLTESTFDQLFNGNSGYRAQYYLSPEEGILYNHDVIQAILPSIATSYQAQPLRVPIEFVERSLTAPHAKIWVFNEVPAFDAAIANTLSPPRWVENNASRGRKAPLPAHLMLDLKGSFINFATDDLYIFELKLKLERARDLFLRGYT